MASMVDVAFALRGDPLPREHRAALADAVERDLPWMRGLPGAGVHRLNLPVSTGPSALLSLRTRLTLRVPRERADEAAALEGRRLQVGGSTLLLGAAHQRELLAWGTLYAHLVTTGDDGDELAFLRAVDDELAALGVAGRVICGRAQALEAGSVHGYSLMIDSLSAADSLRVLQSGVGANRRLGCGLFVPHKSAAAVGAPA